MKNENNKEQPKHNLGELGQTYILELEAKIKDLITILNFQKDSLDAKDQRIKEYGAHKTHCSWSKGGRVCDCGFDGITAATIDGKVIEVCSVTVDRADIPLLKKADKDSTPAEKKAVELIESFKPFVDAERSGRYDRPTMMRNAKRCALVCVFYMKKEVDSFGHEWFEEVKRELESL